MPFILKVQYRRGLRTRTLYFQTGARAQEALARLSDKRWVTSLTWLKNTGKPQNIWGILFCRDNEGFWRNRMINVWPA